VPSARPGDRYWRWWTPDSAKSHPSNPRNSSCRSYRQERSVLRPAKKPGQIGYCHESPNRVCENGRTQPIMPSATPMNRTAARNVALRRVSKSSLMIRVSRRLTARLDRLCCTSYSGTKPLRRADDGTRVPFAGARHFHAAAPGGSAAKSAEPPSPWRDFWPTRSSSTSGRHVHQHCR